MTIAPTQVLGAPTQVLGAPSYHTYPVEKLRRLVREHDDEIDRVLLSIRELEASNDLLRKQADAILAERDKLEQKAYSLVEPPSGVKPTPALKKPAAAVCATEPEDVEVERSGNMEDRQIVERAPQMLIVDTPKVCAECSGVYDLVSSLTYSNYPVWKQRKGPNHMFSSPEEMVLVGEVESFDDACEVGAIASVTNHCGVLPQDIFEWQRDDGLGWIEDMEIVVRLPEPQDMVDDEEESSDSDDDCDSSGAGGLPARSVTMYAFPKPEEFLTAKSRRIFTM